MANAKGKHLILELNEFNRDLLVNAAKKFGFKNLIWLAELKETKTWTEDTYESDWLEPWSQWVTVHTGLKTNEHKIKHLGDVPDLNQPQIWEALSEKGISTGVWGVLNGKKGNASECKFFIPDPWTFSESESPSNLRGLIDLPRYFAKNRVIPNPFLILTYLFRLLLLLPAKAYLALFKEAVPILKALWAFKFGFSGLFLIFEYAATVCFTVLMKKYNPQVGILFLNSIAHIQHYYWTKAPESQNQKLYWLFYFMDKCVETLRSELPEYSLVVFNALSQQNTNHEAPWILYRAKDYKKLFEAIDVYPSQIEPLMSYDATLFFKTKIDRDLAYKKMSALTINGKNLFKVETEGHPDERLFFRIDFFDEATQNDTFLTIDKKPMSFYGYFSKIIQRTAKHHQEGTIFSQSLSFPTEIKNEEFFSKFIENC